MRTTYSLQLVGLVAVADLVEMAPGEYLLTRINVPAMFRGLGYGSQLLDDVLRVADEEGATLTVQPSPSGGLDAAALIDWYERRGFADEGDERGWVRPPKGERSRG